VVEPASALLVIAGIVIAWAVFTPGDQEWQDEAASLAEYASISTNLLDG